MYCWMHRDTGEVVRTVSEHYFGFNHPEWMNMNVRYNWEAIGVSIALALTGNNFYDWIKQFPLKESIHYCNGVCAVMNS